MQIQQREYLLFIFSCSHPQFGDEVVYAGWCRENLHLCCQKHVPHNGFFRAVTRNRHTLSGVVVVRLFVCLFVCLFVAAADDDEVERLGQQLNIAIPSSDRK